MSFAAAAANGVKQAGNTLIDPIEAPPVIVLALPVGVGDERVAGKGAEKQDACSRVDPLIREPGVLNGLHDKDDIEWLVPKREIVECAMGLEFHAALPGDSARNVRRSFAAPRLEPSGKEGPAGLSGRSEPGGFSGIGTSAEIPFAQEQDTAGSVRQSAQRAAGHHSAHDAPPRHRGHQSVREAASAVAPQEWTCKRQEHAGERTTPDWERRR